ncbi:ATP-binding cassette domain-containing protein [Streptomyces chumphonensis]|uniref:ATP-binding cassette domain-containing protein n=1 Tax=Streptomyces chumphonensis TaxID=1214925 RepID=UPI003D71F384
MEGAAVSARDLGLKGSKGAVFEGVSLEAPPGTLIAVTGPSGSGRTCLLLTLTGRMRPTSGHATVAGHRVPQRMGSVRRVAALGPVPGVTDLEPSWTVTEHLRERALLRRPRRGLRRERAAERRERVAEALDRAGLRPGELPKGPRTTVRHLERLEALRLGVALALLDRPRLLALDDADLKLSDPERAELWELLRGLAKEGTTVLAVCSEPPPDVLAVRTTADEGPGEPDEERDDAPEDAPHGEPGDAPDDDTTGEGDADDASTTTGRA